MKFLDDSSSWSVSSELRRIFTDRAAKLNENLRKQVSILTTMNFDEYKFLTPRNAKEFEILCCVSWYLEDTWKFLVQQDLLKKARTFGPDHEIRINLLLTTEPEMICYLLDSSVLGRNTREVFGCLLATQIHFRFITFSRRRPRRPEFKRGYRDHGSRVPIHKQHSDYKNSHEAREEQLRIEEDRQNLIDATDLVRDMIQ